MKQLSTAALAGALVALVGVLVWLLVHSSSAPPPPPPPYHRLMLATRLTQKRAIDLTREQMLGDAPLHQYEVEIGKTPTLMNVVPPSLHDILMSMKEDAHSYQWPCAEHEKPTRERDLSKCSRGFDGICAMNYNVPVSVCYMPQLGSERDLVLFNLKMIGFSQNVSEGGEATPLCDEGRTLFGSERFNFVWVEFWDQNGEFQYLKVPGRISRVIQHMAWLNRGVTVCDPLSSQQQATVLFQVLQDFRAMNN